MLAHPSLCCAQGDDSAFVVEIAATSPAIPDASDSASTEQVPASAEREPATPSARKVLDVLARVEAAMKQTKYQHVTRVNEALGLFYWDCSGMADWVLRRAAPTARRALPKQRPLARDFFSVISRSSSAKARRGWLKIEDPDEISPGDVFAWVKPHFWRHHKNTGHVGFIVGTPTPSPHFRGVLLMKIADATRALHEDDSRPAGGEGGYGTATVAFLFNARGDPMAYGWYGEDQPPQSFVPTKIVFGRVTQ
jgi:hypothetical protein